MDASIQLLELYDQWKHLTEREGAAILAADWPRVHDCQQRKQKLQPEIIRASDLVKNSSRHSAGREFEPRLRECINELIRLETNNSATLETRLKKTREEKENLDRTSNRLRQIHRSYVPAQAPAWNHYS